MLLGFDASAAQGAIPWAKLAANDLRFGIFKAQQGNDGFDPTFASNVQHATDAGLTSFAYCFAYPLPILAGHSGRSPAEQARLFVDRVHAARPELEGRPLFLDYEWPEIGDWAKWGCTSQSISDWCCACAAEVEAYSKVTPVLYTYPYWWAAVSKADVSWAAHYPLWLAAYVRACPTEGGSPHVPAPWDDWTFWQWDGNGGQTLPNGVDADFVVFNGDADALAALAPTPG